MVLGIHPGSDVTEDAVREVRCTVCAPARSLVCLRG